MYEILYSIAIFSIISYIFYSWYNPKLVYVRSRVDKQIYVVRNSEDKQQAADLLANVSKRLHKLVSNSPQVTVCDCIPGPRWICMPSPEAAPHAHAE